MLNDKIEIPWNREGKEIHFYWTLGHCGVEVNEKLTRRQSNQSKKAEIVSYYYERHIFKPRGKRKAKRSLTVTVKTPKRTGENATLKGTTGMVRLRGSVR
jgi:hypothetical protein